MDSSTNDLPGTGQFVDACGIQIPSRMEPEPPDPQMGAPGKPVEITFWRADWQAMVNGREDSVKSLFPNAAIDHYPFDAPPLDPDSPEQREFEKRYAPSDALGNRRAGQRDSPVEDLVAEGPATLSPAAKTLSRGAGVHTSSGWSVVIVRPLPAGLAPPARTQVAFAVWQGAQN